MTSTRRFSIAFSLAAAATMLGAVAWHAWPTTRHFGARPADAKERAEFVATLRGSSLSSAAPALIAKTDRDDQSPILLYRPLNDAWLAKRGVPFRVQKQGIGDCVSWGSKHAVDIHTAVLWRIGAISDWKEAATEPIYGGSRVEARGIRFGGWSDGSTGYDAAKWLKNWGVLYRENYPAVGVDLSAYSSSRAKEWGAYGCGGKDDAGRLDELAKAHPIRDVAPCTTWDEAIASLRSGYPIIVCSNQGFEYRRDKDGFSSASGHWAHCMCFIGARFDREGLLCINSWGDDWISGPKWPPDQPDGSFWVERRRAEYMLQGGGFGSPDSWSVSGLEGFPWNPIDHERWVMPAPSRSDARADTEPVGTLAL